MVRLILRRNDGYDVTEHVYSTLDIDCPELEEWITNHNGGWSNPNVVGAELLPATPEKGGE